MAAWVVLATLVGASGCVRFTGSEMTLDTSGDRGMAFEDPIAAPLRFEGATVDDQTPERAFGPVASTFGQALPAFQQMVAARKGFCKTCDAPPEQARYRVITALKVTAYRPSNGGRVLAWMGAIFLPPLLGALWSFPVGYGAMTGQVTWSLVDGEGSALTTTVWPYDDKIDAFRLNAHEFMGFLRNAHREINRRTQPSRAPARR